MRKGHLLRQVPFFVEFFYRKSLRQNAAKVYDKMPQMFPEWLGYAGYVWYTFR